MDLKTKIRDATQKYANARVRRSIALHESEEAYEKADGEVQGATRYLESLISQIPEPVNTSRNYPARG